MTRTERPFPEQFKSAHTAHRRWARVVLLAPLFLAAFLLRVVQPVSEPGTDLAERRWLRFMDGGTIGGEAEYQLAIFAGAQAVE
jgi:hypothetical protein